VTTVVPAKVAAFRDAHEGLNGVLWMQTAAEYWALASSAYRHAQIALEESLRDTSWTGSLEQGSGYEGRPGAVILDLDETVFDNSPLQAQLVLDGTLYLPATWDDWVDKTAAGLVPGAKRLYRVCGKQRSPDVFCHEPHGCRTGKDAHKPCRSWDTGIRRHRPLRR
jgi:acid phosphatase